MRDKWDIDVETSGIGSLRRIQGRCYSYGYFLGADVRRVEICLQFAECMGLKLKETKKLQLCYEAESAKLDKDYQIKEGDFCDEQSREHVEKYFDMFKDCLVPKLEYSQRKNTLILSACDKRYAGVFLRLVKEHFQVPVESFFDKLKLDRRELLPFVMREPMKLLDGGDYDGAFKVALGAKNDGHKGVMIELGKYCESRNEFSWAVGFYQAFSDGLMTEKEQTMHQEAQNGIFRILQMQKQNLQFDMMDDDFTPEEKADNLMVEWDVLLSLSIEEQPMIDRRFNELAGVGLKETLIFQNVRGDGATLLRLGRYIADQSEEINRLKAKSEKLKSKFKKPNMLGEGVLDARKTAPESKKMRLS